MKGFDRIFENASRSLARRSSRRSLLAGLGVALVGAGAIPALPVARAAGPKGAKPDAPHPAATGQDPGDQTSCDYWRYCAIDGMLCSCCGGGPSQCPPGTTMSVLTWIGTCRNPADGRNYIIAYNDCCGASACGQCMCNTNISERPMVRPQASNDINWCVGSESQVINCSTAAIIGLATEQGR